MTSITENFHLINEKINRSSLNASRKPDDVKLIVVVKRQPITKIEELVQAGAFRFGDNYPEETALKVEALGNNESLEWHMIGHIQSRKIKYITRYFSCVHSIDNIDTAQKLNSSCVEKSIIMPVLIEVNVSGEQSKFGFDAQEQTNWGQICNAVNDIQEMGNLKLRGLMTMPPFTTQKGSNRIYFEKCRKLLEYINNSCKIEGFTELSMGTSSDFEDAIKEGATYLRIGEAILGPRPN